MLLPSGMATAEVATIKSVVTARSVSAAADTLTVAQAPFKAPVATPAASSPRR